MAERETGGLFAIGMVCQSRDRNASMSGMMSFSGIGRLLSILPSILAVLGLAVAPVARPAIAMSNGGMSNAGMSNAGMAIAGHAADHAAMAMPEGMLPEDMPCCPKKAPIPNCDKDCPLMAMCATQLLCNAAQGLLVVPLGLAGFLLPGNEFHVAGLSQAPPPRPPNT